MRFFKPVALTSTLLACISIAVAVDSPEVGGGERHVPGDNFGEVLMKAQAGGRSAVVLYTHGQSFSGTFVKLERSGRIAVITGGENGDHYVDLSKVEAVTIQRTELSRDIKWEPSGTTITPGPAEDSAGKLRLVPIAPIYSSVYIEAQPPLPDRDKQPTPALPPSVLKRPLPPSVMKEKTAPESTSE